MVSHPRAPAQASSFVGRDVELARIVPLLADCRLLTVTGTGGVGKTRLSLEALRRANEREPWETFVVPLGMLARGELVTPAVLDALGGQEPGRGLGDTLAARLQGRRVRLLLDSCEHVSASVRELVTDLLARCPDLRILTTARHPLGAADEVVSLLAPMSVPAADQHDPLLAVVESEAGRLFVACAKTQLHDFAVTNANAAAVARICRELDGLPLAIALAAAGVRERSPQLIADGLADRLQLRTVDGPGRQRGLRASLDWSYDLLAPAEQRLFRRLSVLARATAERVCSVCAYEQDPQQVRAQLAGLLEHGVLERRRDPLLGGYYEMLATVREYAGDRLLEADEEVELRDRHLTVLGELSREADDLLNHPAGRRTLDLHLPDLRAALDHAIGRHPPAALQICRHLAHFWFAADHLEEGRRCCARALDAAGEEAEPALRAHVLWCAAMLAAVVEDYATSHALAVEGLALAQACGDQRAVGLCLQITCFALGTVDPSGAAEAGGRAVKLLRATGSERDLGHALMTLASVQALRDRFEDFDAARAEFMAIAPACGDEWLRILLDLHAAWAYLTQGDTRRTLEQIEAVLESVGGEVSMRAALARSHRLHALARSGEADRALTEGTVELSAARAGGPEVAVLAFEQALAVVALALGDLDGARRRAEPFLNAPALHSAVLGREILATVALERDEEDEASVHAEAIRGIAQRTASPRQAALADHLDARAAIRRGNLHQAATLLHAALGAQAEHACRRDVLDTLEALGILAVHAGDPVRGARLLAASSAGRRALGCVRVPPDGRELRDARARIDAELGGEAARARAGGERLRPEEAVEYAQRSRGKRERALAGWASLTPTEAQSARLAASGLSNPEIAARMFVSRGTVKSHLSSAYGKLRVTNRTELAMRLAELQAQPPDRGEP